MPMYAYHCEFGHSFELLQPIAESAVQTCIDCGARASRVIVSVNFNAKQGKKEVVRDRYGNDTIKHWDGRQDVTIHNAKMIPTEGEPRG